MLCVYLYIYYIAIETLCNFDIKQLLPSKVSEMASCSSYECMNIQALMIKVCNFVLIHSYSEILLGLWT